ncbi:MAG: hypothetical protein AB7O74_01635 [Candidatus Nanopelagicales bacterium]
MAASTATSSLARAAGAGRLWLVALGCAAAVLGPALGAGYVLHADQVFVPVQDLLPWMLGVGAGLPRAVPQDAVVAVLSGPVPGWVLEKSALLAALVLLAVGAGRLVRPRGTGAAVVTAVVAVWSAYVAERLLLGHWSLLLAVAALPWALEAARSVRAGAPRAGARWILWLGLASLTPSGGLLVLAATAPALLVPGGRGPRVRRWILVGVGAALQLPWAVAALLHPGAVAGATGADVFAARSEGPWGLLLTVLTTGGAWNASAVPGSRTTWWGIAVGVLVLLVAAVGARGAIAVLGRSIALPLAVLATLGLGWCLLGGWSATAPAAEWAVASLPGGGLLRDAQKWLAPWALLVAMSAGVGAARLARAVARRSGDRAAGAALLAGLALLPVAALPDLAWGAAGRLAAAAYPDDLTAVRAALEDTPPGDVVSLPWQTFRAFPWNDGGRVSLDPVPRAMPRTVLASSSLPVSSGGEVVTVPGDDPRAAEVDAALVAGEPLGPVLARLGVGYAVVATDVPGAGDELPEGARALVRGDSFSLYALALPAGPAPERPVAAPAAALAAYALVLLAAGLSLLRRRRSSPVRV